MSRYQPKLTAKMADELCRWIAPDHRSQYRPGVVGMVIGFPQWHATRGAFYVLRLAEREAVVYKTRSVAKGRKRAPSIYEATRYRQARVTYAVIRHDAVPVVVSRHATREAAHHAMEDELDDGA